MFDSNQFFGGGAGGFYPKTIDQSLRFNDNDSAYLSRTPASAFDSNKTFTYSFWLKRGNLGGSQTFYSATNATEDKFLFHTDNTLRWYNNSANDYYLYTSQVFRDVSSWYHIVFSFDTTQATAADRVKLYVNGEQVTAFSSSSYPTQNYTFSRFGTSGVANSIGRDNNNGQYFDGYLAEVHFTDGTAYTADAFGELKSGVWVAKTPSVTYGTNGFYLDFANSADIGNDVSGEGNDWTPNNFTASDVVLDSPTDNFCVINPLDSTVNSLSDGNLRVSTATSGSRTACGSISENSGKWYWEVTSLGGSENIIGVVDASYSGVSSTIGYQFSGSVFYYRSGTKSIDGSFTSYGASYTTNDVIGIALDLDGGTVAFYKNNVSQGSITLPSTGTGSWKPSLSSGTGAANQVYTANFGQLGFTYTPPTGYLALSTANLPEPTISPADDASPEDYFNTVLYTGSSSDLTIDTNFSPEFIWVKNRVRANEHVLFDIVRGNGNELISNSTNAENDTNPDILTINSSSFTVLTGINRVNTTLDSSTYVAWHWKANGSGVSNTDGSITSTVSANTTSGFSIVSYTGNSTNGATVGHGLSQKPDMIIVKSRDEGTTVYTGRWQTYHSALGADFYIYLESTDAASNTLNNRWNDTEPDSSVFTLGNAAAGNYTGDTYIAYCFHSVEGFSKFGSYVGNGSTDGPFVYTGFRPAFVLIKRTDTTGSWFTYDSTRDSFNSVDDVLFPDLSNAEAQDSSSDIDFLANGFKHRSTTTAVNGVGGTYIYMAFAENPFKYSTAR